MGRISRRREQGKKHKPWDSPGYLLNENVQRKVALTTPLLRKSCSSPFETNSLYTAISDHVSSSCIRFFSLPSPPPPPPPRVTVDGFSNCFHLSTGIRFVFLEKVAPGGFARERETVLVMARYHSTGLYPVHETVR